MNKVTTNFLAFVSVFFFFSLKAQTPVYTRFIAQPDTILAQAYCNTMGCNPNTPPTYRNSYGFIVKKINLQGDTIILDSILDSSHVAVFELTDTMSVGDKFFVSWFNAYSSGGATGYFILTVWDSNNSKMDLPLPGSPKLIAAFLINNTYYYQAYNYYDSSHTIYTYKFDGTNWVKVSGLPSDIALTITAPANYSKYTPLSFTVTAKNTGSAATKDIKIQLPPVVNTVYGGTPTASNGDYKEYCPGNIYCRTWTIPNLNAGDSATLTVPVFVLDPNGANIIAKAGLVSSTPTDGNPANDTASAIIVGTTPSQVGEPDIAVSISASSTTYSKFTFLNYTVTAKNTGNTEMRDVQIKFTPPNGTANPGNTTASDGIYQDYCAGGVHCQTWRIPVLGINQSATLLITIFVLDPGVPITAKASLTASTPTDMNSTNDIGSVTISQAVSFQESGINQLVSAHSNQPVLSPNPAIDEVNMEMQSTREQPVRFMFYNMQGSNIMSEQRQLTTGTNRFVFDVSDFPAGLYYVQTVGEKIYTPTVKMIKN